MDTRTLMDIARCQTLSEQRQACERALLTEDGPNWRYGLGKHIEWTLSVDRREDSASIFVKGNIKLPFWAFSTLPVMTCPGMGPCGIFCYSFKNWRYPAPFFRQVRNTWLIQNRPDIIYRAFDSIPLDTTVRLYVDGDMDSLATLSFWMQALEARPDIAAYGYSKSWALFLEYDHRHNGHWPSNYWINLSSGSKYGADVAEQMKRLSIYRGEFIAVEIDASIAHMPNNLKYESAAYKDAVRQAAGAAGYDRIFVCPGHCESCTKRGHACGLESFVGIPIAIGIH